MAFNDKEQWLKEFTEFSQIDVKDVEVPKAIFKNLRARLFPNPWVVFGKIAGLHVIVGFFSLSICNQFGLNPFQTDQGLTDWFMKVAGHNVCMFLCGVFFVSATYLLSNFLLSLEELEAVRRYEWLQTGVIGLVSLSAFYFFGAELVATFAVLWLIGALLGGLLAIEGSYRLRRQLTWG
ncbi:MAG: hypothetical protein AB7G93_04770 [Bdellovibrionales bacterium]